MRVSSAIAAICSLGLQGCIIFDDYNYDGIVFEAAVCPHGDCSWSKRIGGAYDQLPRTVTLSENGDLFVAGRFKGQIGLGSGSISTASAQENSPFAVQYDGQGKPLCLYTFSQAELGESFAVLPVGNKLIWGGYLGAPEDNELAFLRISNGCNMSTPLGDTFDVKPVGRVSSLVLSNDGSSVYVTGTVLGIGSMECGSTTIPYDSLGSTLFLSEIEIATGICRWAKVYPGADVAKESVQMIRGGPSRLLIAGTYTGTIEGWPMTNEVYRSAFVISVDTNGGTIKATNVFRAAMNNGAKTVGFKGLATKNKTVYFAGENQCDQMLDIDNNAVHSCSIGHLDAFLATLNLDTLSLQAVTAIGGNGAQQISAIAVDDKGGVHLAGLFDSELAFEAGGTPTTCTMGRCTFLAKLEDATAIPDSVTMLSTAEMHQEANVLLSANRLGLALAAGSSVSMTVTPNNPHASSEGTGYVDVVMARLYPPP